MTDAQPGVRLTWADRFRGAMLGGAVGDALGSGVRTATTAEIQSWFGPHGVADYLPVYGRRGAVTDVTQLGVFTLEGLLRAKAANPGGVALNAAFVLTNHLRWLHTQGVPWEFAMRGCLPSDPAPSGWLLERPELYSTRNPAGFTLALFGRMADRSPLGPDGLLRPVAHVDGLAEAAAWSGAAAVWSAAPEQAHAAGALIANLSTSGPNAVAAAGLHSDVLGQLVRGVPLWDAVGDADRQRLGRAYPIQGVPADVRRTVHAAMFVGQRGAVPMPSDLDVEFDLADKPGELGIALAAVGSTRTFADAVRVAVNHSGDSAVTGALAGQLAGALHGPTAIPSRWLDELELREVIEVLCQDAAEAFAPPRPPQWAQRYVPGPVGGVPGLTAGSPGTVEGSAERTTVLPAIGAEPQAPEDDAPTPPRGIGAPTFPARRGAADVEPSSTGPIPLPWLGREPADATTVIPIVDEAPDVAEPSARVPIDLAPEPDPRPSWTEPPAAPAPPAEDDGASDAPGEAAGDDVPETVAAAREPVVPVVGWDAASMPSAPPADEPDEPAPSVAQWRTPPPVRPSRAGRSPRSRWSAGTRHRRCCASRPPRTGRPRRGPRRRWRTGRRVSRPRRPSRPRRSPPGRWRTGRGMSRPRRPTRRTSRRRCPAGCRVSRSRRPG
ncbi:ADP-ribosylglycohydrolase family protein [Saccharopolyspora sp. CA-218241]|uniref:ADP-ribosylglycohydrolase family protein n=1 Tax=Saccharopolyspora sp. CA-218241 TaxID=3240027 RepID=UPI003D97EE54